MRQLSIILSALAIMVLPVTSPASTTACSNQPEVEVIYAKTDAVQDICISSAKAIEILRSFGLAPKRQIVIEIIERDINHLGYMAYGSYNSRTDRIELMSYESILKRHRDPVMYDEFFDRIHYGGAIAHEIAHAVFHHHSLNMSPGPAPQEYLAHAVQLASLPKEKRDKIIARMNVAPWESGDAISDIYMAIEPTGFAVKSYLHLTNIDNQRVFIDTLLKSKWFYVYIP